MRWTAGYLVLFAFSLHGQNLVVNPSFEIFSQCPNATAQVTYAIGWTDPTDATSDYFDSCSTNGQGVPNNWAGSQPARTGGGYIGLGVQNNTLREYVSGSLADTLLAGRRYCVEFYVSLCGGYSSAGIDQLGAYFSDDTTFTLYEPILVNPQIESPQGSSIMDTTNWTRVSGAFTAIGTECTITIGTFRADSLITFDTIWSAMVLLAYYYIDDVSVYEISDCFAGSNTTICYRDSIQLGAPPQPNIMYSWLPADGLSNANISNPIASPDTSITYTLTQIECDAVTTSSVTVTVDHGCHSAAAIVIPSILFGNQNLFISGLESNSKLELFDDRGRLIFSQEDYQNGFWSTNLAQGMYVARLTRPSGEKLQQRVCVVR